MAALPLTKFNLSDYDYPNKIWIHVPVGEMILKTILLFIVSCFGLFSNFMMLRLIVLNRTLQTPIYIVVANMAVSNFLTLLICPGLFLVADFFQNYILGPWGCIFDNSLTPAFLTTSVLNLCVVSYVRLTAIALPRAARLTMFGAKIVVVSTWILGFLFTSPIAIYREYKVHRWKNFVQKFCNEDKVLHAYWYFLIAVMVWIPLAVLVICIAIIFYKLDRFEKRLLKHEHPIIVSYKWIVAKNLSIIIIVFALMRIPYTIMVLMRHITDKELFRIFWFLAQFFMYVNTSINPLFYGYTNELFRRAYRETPLCYCCRNKSKQLTYISNINNIVQL